jgi:hypothetical protein
LFSEDELGVRKHRVSRDGSKLCPALQAHGSRPVTGRWLENVEGIFRSGSFPLSTNPLNGPPARPLLGALPSAPVVLDLSRLPWPSQAEFRTPS